MNQSSTVNVHRVACIGAGVIGAGWAVHFLARGLEVAVWDSAQGMRNRIERFIADAWQDLARRGPLRDDWRNRLSFAATLQEAVATAQFVQESGPERLDIKREIIAAIDAMAGRDIVIASSTSGFTATEIQQGVPGARRILVGHPFNPPYLMPLVEVVAGLETEPSVVDWLASFYASLGKRVLRVRGEMPGFIANRLQEAVWREALHLIERDLATVEEIDAAMSFGPGLRWSFMGPFLQSELTGGDGGIRKSLAQFAPEIRRPWAYAPLPQMSSTLMERIVAGCADEVAGRSAAELVRERNGKLIAVLDALGL